MADTPFQALSTNLDIVIVNRNRKS